MLRMLTYILAGYLSGSILFARLFGMLLKNSIITDNGKDKNPGAANAFKYGGFLCGMLTLFFDMLKGFLPVYMYLRMEPGGNIGLIFVLSAPVLGHNFSIFNKLHGGKGIAVSFGCLLGCFPDLTPALSLAVPFIFFSVILKVSPHYYRTFLSYISAFIIMIFLKQNPAVVIGFFIILGAVGIKLHTSTENKERMSVGFLWKH